MTLIPPIFVVAVHVVLCVLLVLIILLQPGKGGDVGSAFGGGGTSTMFGPRGPAGLLARATTVVAVMFMVTSITLSLESSRSENHAGSVDEEQRILERELSAGADDPAAEAAPEAGSEPMELPAPAGVDGTEVPEDAPPVP